MLQCKECKKFFETIQSLSGHVNKKHWPTKIVCWISDKKLLTLQQYNNRIFRLKKCEACFTEFLPYESIQKFCSRKCSHSVIDHSHPMTEVQKKNLSYSMKKYFDKNKTERICVQCETTFISGLPNAKCCSNKCSSAYWKSNQPIATKKKLGGYREKAGRGVMGYFKGIFCNSTYEAAYIHFCIENGMDIQRNLKGFPYIDENGKERKYYPDFIVDGKYVEVKGYMTKRTKCKFDHFPHPIEVIDTIKIKPMLSKIKKDYNILDIREILEPQKLITKTCEYCQNDFSRYKNKNRFCSYKCAALSRNNHIFQCENISIKCNYCKINLVLNENWSPGCANKNYRKCKECNNRITKEYYRNSENKNLINENRRKKYAEKVQNVSSG